MIDFRSLVAHAACNVSLLVKSKPIKMLMERGDTLKRLKAYC